MDAETREYLDQMMSVIEQHFESLAASIDPRIDDADAAPEPPTANSALVIIGGSGIQSRDVLPMHRRRHSEALPLDQEAIADLLANLNDRSMSAELRTDLFEVRVQSLLAALDERMRRVERSEATLERRISTLERQLLDLNLRVDGLAESTRQQFHGLHHRQMRPAAAVPGPRTES